LLAINSDKILRWNTRKWRERSDVVSVWSEPSGKTHLYQFVKSPARVLNTETDLMGQIGVVRRAPLPNEAQHDRVVHPRKQLRLGVHSIT